MLAIELITLSVLVWIGIISLFALSSLKKDGNNRKYRRYTLIILTSLTWLAYIWMKGTDDDLGEVIIYIIFFLPLIILSIIFTAFETAYLFKNNLTNHKG